MKKTLLFGFFMLSIPAMAQIANWNYTDDQLTFKDNAAYTKDGTLVNGLVKSNMYDYYNIAQFENGKPVGTVNFYKNNGMLVGSATVPSEGNTLIETNPDSEEYKQMMESYDQDEFNKNQMHRYVYSCYLNFKNMLSHDGGSSAQNMNCQDIVPEYIKNGIGKPEAFKARRINGNIVVETPFIAQKYRHAILMENGKDGVFFEIQRTGNAVAKFTDNK